MSNLAGPTAPRRLLQTHGAFINATLVPRLKNRREWNTGNAMEMQGAPLSADEARLNAAMKSISQDECFDAREGEICMYSKNLSGFPSHRRAVVFTSVNGHKVDTAVPPRNRDPQRVLYDSDWKFVGLCQNGFVSSNTALQDQGMALQTSGIKTVVNVSEETM